MDVCSWDWGAIGSFVGAGATLIGAGIASFVAWCISKQWKNQKGTEVIANEAKTIFYEVCEFHKHIDYIINYEVTEKGLINAFDKIENLSVDINNKLLFLEENIDDKNLQSYRRSLNKLILYISSLIESSESTNPSDIKNDILDGLNINLNKPDSYYKNYKFSFEFVKKTLIDISLYKF